MYKNVDIANSKFVGFTKPRLEKRLSILTDIIIDVDALDDEIAEAALLRKEVKELLSVFAECEKLGLDTSGMTAADILESVTGESIEKLQKKTPAGDITQDVLDKTTQVVKKTSTVTKRSLNVFGSWLASKTS